MTDYIHSNLIPKSTIVTIFYIPSLLSLLFILGAAELYKNYPKMQPSSRRLLSTLLSRSRYRRYATDSKPRRPNPPSSLLTHQLNVQPKVFERELWYIFDNIDQHPWISRDELSEIQGKIVDLKKMKKALNPLLRKQRQLKDEIERLSLKPELEQEMKHLNETELNEDFQTAANLRAELAHVTAEANPRVAQMEIIEDEIFDRIVFFPNCRPSENTAEEDRVILSVKM